MRALVLILALVFACTASALAAATSSTSTDSTMSNSSSNHATGSSPTPTGEEMADACIANSIGMTAQEVHQLRAQGLTYADIAMAQSIAKKACKPICDVINAWKECKNWPDTASKFGLSTSDLTRWPMMGSTDAESFNSAFISQYFGVAQSEIAQLRKDGVSWDEIYLIVNAATRTAQPISQIASLRSQGMSWNDIAAKYNISAADLVCPVAPKRVMTATGAGPECPAPCPACPITCPSVMYGPTGNVLLTEDMAISMYAQGNDWLDVAVSANMSMVTGVPITWFLGQIRAGRLWPSLLTEYNVSPKVAYNVTQYPFPHRTIYSQKMENTRLGMIQKYQCTPSQCPGCSVMSRRMFTASPSFNPTIP